MLSGYNLDVQETTVHSQAVEDNVANHDLSSRIVSSIDLLPPRQRYCKGSAANEVVQKIQMFSTVFTRDNEAMETGG